MRSDLGVTAAKLSMNPISRTVQVCSGSRCRFAICRLPRRWSISARRRPLIPCRDRWRRGFRKEKRDISPMSGGEIAMRVVSREFTAQDCGGSGRDLLQCDHFRVHSPDDVYRSSKITGANENIVSPTRSSDESAACGDDARPFFEAASNNPPSPSQAIANIPALMRWATRIHTLGVFAAARVRIPSLCFVRSIVGFHRDR
jgi:hypothetical protein